MSVRVANSGAGGESRSVTGRSTISDSGTPHRRIGHAPSGALLCLRCGFSFYAAAMEHEHVLVAAACCPRCDGQLVDDTGARRFKVTVPDASVYLG
jgi:hypothetical protein